MVISPVSFSSECDLPPMEPITMFCAFSPDQLGTFTSSNSPSHSSSDSSSCVSFILPQTHTMDDSTMSGKRVDSAGASDHIDINMVTRPLHGDMIDPAERCMFPPFQMEYFGHTWVYLCTNQVICGLCTDCTRLIPGLSWDPLVPCHRTQCFFLTPKISHAHFRKA